MCVSSDSRLIFSYVRVHLTLVEMRPNVQITKKGETLSKNVEDMYVFFFNPFRVSYALFMIKLGRFCSKPLFWHMHRVTTKSANSGFR